MKNLIFGILILVLVSGCIQIQTKYVCSDGTIVNDASLCSKRDESKTSINTIKEDKKEPEEIINKPEEWYEVKTFMGSSPKTTEPFKINSKRWRYTFNCYGLNEYSMYNLAINKLTNDQPTQIEFRMMAKCENKGEPSYIYEGFGEYFFNIDLANIDSWTIKVEALK